MGAPSMGGMHWDVPRPFQGGFEGMEGIPVCLQRGPPFHVPMHPLSSSERGAERYSRPDHRKGRHVHPYDGDAHQSGIYDQARRHSRYSFAFRDRVPGSTEGSHQSLFSLPHDFEAPEAGAPYYEAARAALHRNPRPDPWDFAHVKEGSSEGSAFFTYKTGDLNEFFVNHPAISNGQMSYDAHVAGSMVTASGAIQPFSFTINKHTGVLMSPYGVRDMTTDELERERTKYLDKVASELFAGVVNAPLSFHFPYEPQVESDSPTLTTSSPLHPRPNVTMHRVDLRNQWGGAYTMEVPTQPTEESCEWDPAAIISELSRIIA